MRDSRALIETARPSEGSGQGNPVSVAYFSPAWPPDASPNGIVAYVEAISSGLRAQGHRASILAAQVANHDDPRVYDLQKFDPATSPLRRIADKIAFRLRPEPFLETQLALRVASATHRAITEQGAQVLEMEESFGWALTVGRLVALPMIVRLHGPWFLNGPAQGTPQDEAFRRRVLREGEAIASASVVTASSADVLEQTRAYYGLPLSDAEVIHPPLPPVPEADRWRIEASEPGLILFVGRFDRHKGGDVMLEAFGLLAESHPGAKFLFVGPDNGVVDDQGRLWSIHEYLRDKLPGLAASGRLEYAGKRPNSALPALRRRASVTAVASRYDNFPTTVMEAMTHGCPLVAARVGGIPEIVTDGESGLLFQPGNPADLAQKLGSLLDDPAMAIRLGRRASEEAEAKVGPGAIAGRMIEVYRRVIARGGGLRRP